MSDCFPIKDIFGIDDQPTFGDIVLFIRRWFLIDLLLFQFLYQLIIFLDLFLLWITLLHLDRIGSLFFFLIKVLFHGDGCVINFDEKDASYTYTSNH